MLKIIQEIYSNNNLCPFSKIYKQTNDQNYEFESINGIYFDNPLGKDYGLFLNTFSFVKFFNYILYIEFLIPIIGAVLILKYQRKYLKYHLRGFQSYFRVSSYSGE